MIIPLANAIFDGKLNIKNFIKKKKKKILENLFLKKLIKKFFHY